MVPSEALCSFWGVRCEIVCARDRVRCKSRLHVWHVTTAAACADAPLVLLLCAVLLQIPLVIRETVRKYQLILAHKLVLQKAQQ